MNAVAIIQARMGSTRLPGKSLTAIAGMPALGWTVRAAGAIPGIDTVVVATSEAADDDAIRDWCRDAGVRCFRGDERDVLTRFAGAAREAGADVVMRLTGDCPFLDPAVCDQVLHLLVGGGLAYASNVDPARWPDGLDCEAMTMAALAAADAEARRPSDREHVTPYIRNHRDRFGQANLDCPLPDLWRERWTLDTPEDLAFLRAVAERLPADRPPSHVEVLRCLDAAPDLRAINGGGQRNEGFRNALIEEAETDGVAPMRGFEGSVRQLAVAERLIPLGAQTFSKSRVQFPVGAAPLFVTHGDGARVWDVDGNEYVDLVNGLLCVSLGYRDPDIDEAVRRQLGRGVSFSLSTALEAELAALMVDLVPCAEMVRFAKSGSDATSAAIRVARAATGRDGVIACGYHGWHDWYIGATSRNRGVPEAVRGLTTTVAYNDVAALERAFAERSDRVAAVIMEPANAVPPAPGYLAAVRDVAHRNGALLVFDEVITGFRFALGGAQALFGVTPDLAAFGKGMANGFPISAVVGRAELMREMEEIFFSATFGGEAVSLAAAIATVRKMQREPVIEALWRVGEALAAKTQALIDEHGLGDTIGLAGLAPWKLIQIREHPRAGAQMIKTMLIYELAARGVLGLGSHNVSYAMTGPDLAQVASAYRGAFAAIREALDSGRFAERLKVPPLQPVFRIR
ncbi:MAG: aminotransferase class III-fold pyridoxal phosphate-dependent enzyme [Alphaproteobacteria bacterium]